MAPQNKQIQFDTVEIREFSIILSNNPSCQLGPSIELGWEYSTDNGAHEIIGLSQYEKEREGKRRKTKKGRPKLYLSQVRREAMLKDAGYTEEEMEIAIKDKEKARRQRSVSKLLCTPERIGQGLVSNRVKKIGRAVRNMERLQRKQNDGSDLFYDKRAIYHGWWLPFSAHYF